MKLKKLLSSIVLLLAFLIGILFRIYKIDQVPMGLNWDEAAVGYNAFLLLETGKDEFLKPWPIMMKSFGEYKTGIYSMMLVPIIKNLGLNIFSVRILNAIIGCLIILVMYWFSKKFFKEKIWASLVALLVASSPFLIHLSRFALEWYLGVGVALVGVGFLIEANNNIKKLTLAVLFLSLSLYFYHALRLILPLIGFAYFIRQRKVLIKETKISLMSIFMGLLIIIPLLSSIKNNPEWSSRITSVSIFNDENYKREFNEEMFAHVYQRKSFVRVFNNKVVFFGKKVIASYLSHFSPDFLLLGGDATPRLGIKNVGKIYLILVVFLLTGIVELIKTRNKFSSWLLLILIGLSPLASSITNDSPHGLRSVMLIPSLIIATVIGLEVAYKTWFRNHERMRKFFLLIIGGVFVFEVLYFQWRYWVFYKNSSALDWQAGHKQMVSWVNQNLDKYDKVIITNYYGQPHIFYAFFSQFSPAEYQEAMATQSGDFNARMSQLGKIEFRAIRDEDFCLKNSLMVAQPGRVPDNIIKIGTVSLDLARTEKEDVFEFVETNNNPLLTKIFCAKHTQ